MCLRDCLGGCGKESIGETRVLRKRVAIHNQKIRDITTRMLQVSTHLDNCAHTKIPRYHIFPFLRCNIVLLVENNRSLFT